MMSLNELHQMMQCYIMLLPRFISCFIVLPVLSKQVLGGALVRNGVCCSLLIFALPIIEDSCATPVQGLNLIFITGKEVILGMLIGFIATIPFWAVESAGFLIDNQRGATMASVLNPTLGSQSSPTGLFLTQTLITLFYSGGAFLILLGALYQSYATWPVMQFFPQPGIKWVDFFYGQFSQMLKLCVLLAAPLLVAMFLAEFGLALISRFAPSLNVFILSMPIKSAIASLLLVLYIGLMMRYAFGSLLEAITPLNLLRPIMQPQ